VAGYLLSRDSLLYSVVSRSEGLLLGFDHQTLVAGLIESHGHQLRRYLYSRVRNAVDVPDIVQEVYLRMMRVPNVESVKSPEAYLFTVAQHVVQQHTLKQSTAPPWADTTHMLRDPSAGSSLTDPALEVYADQCLECLQSGLDQLSPKARAAFLLSRRDGLSFDEIAERLGTTRHMVKKYLSKALTKLRHGLETADLVSGETDGEIRTVEQGKPK
jgi:RNA polymerase sigma factor (sigma-70 family)